MALTVREALKFGGLFGATVVAGDLGLSKQIESVSVLEIAESNISRWVLKNQLYITSFYAIFDNVEQQKIVIESLANHGCCGLVLCYVGTWIQEIDKEIIKFCDEHAFPLIQARTDVSYIEIMSPIMNLLYEEDSQASAINDYSVVRNDFLDLIVNEESSDVIFRKINQRLEKNISYYDTYGKLIFSDKKQEETKIEESYLENNFNHVLYACSSKGYTVQEIGGKESLLVLIRSRKNLFGVFITDYEKESFSDLENYLINPLVVAGALILRKRNRIGNLRAKAMEDYVADLLVWNFPSNEMAVERGKELGVDILDKNNVVLINVNSIQRTVDLKVQQEIQNYVKRVLLSQIEYYIKLYNESNWLTLRSDTIILFLDTRKKNIDMQEFCKHILDIFSKKQNLSISIGVSNSFDRETNIPEAYHQAFQSAVLGREYYGDNKIVFYDSIFFLQKLRQMGIQDETREICYKYLRPIIEHDEDYGTELLETLKCLLENNGNTQRVAQKMFVHKNTILQRKTKITELLGYSPFEMPYLLNLLIVFVIEKTYSEDETLTYVQVHICQCFFILLYTQTELRKRCIVQL